MAKTLTREQWNRTLLARQHLLERVDEDAIEVIDRCVGLQSQDPQAAFFALWSRIEDFDPAELDGLLVDREVVRMALQRGTVFLMDGMDARWIRTVVQPVLDGALATNHVRRLPGVDVDEVLELARSLLDAAGDDGAAGATIRVTLAERWPDQSADSLLALARGKLPLVQLPPRGLWRRGGAPNYQLLDHWIGDGPPMVDGEEARKDLIRMYLRGHGPATATAVATWSGLSGLGSLLAAMEADWELAELIGPDGQKLYDLEGLPLATGSESAPVRFIAPYDGVLVGNADRARVADPEVYAKTVTPNGQSPGFVLVDGRLAAAWSLRGPARGKRTVELTELVDLGPSQRAEVEREAARLAEFAAR